MIQQGEESAKDASQSDQSDLSRLGGDRSETERKDLFDVVSQFREAIGKLIENDSLAIKKVKSGLFSDFVNQVSCCDYSSRGLLMLVAWARYCVEAELLMTLLLVIRRIINESKRSLFGQGSNEFTFPDAFFECPADSADDGLTIPSLRLDNLRGYSFSVFVSLKPHSLNSSHERVLISLESLEGRGIKICLLDNDTTKGKPGFTIVFHWRYVGDKRWHTRRLTAGQTLQYNCWRQIIVSHSQSYLSNSVLTCYIDGFNIGSISIPFPNIGAPVVNNYIGKGLSAKFSFPTLYEGAISDKKATTLRWGDFRHKVTFPFNIPLQRNLQHHYGDYSWEKSRFEFLGSANTFLFKRRQARENAINTAIQIGVENKIISKKYTSLRQIHNRGLHSKGPAGVSENRESSIEHIAKVEVPDRAFRFHFRTNMIYDDLPLIFCYDPRICIGGTIEYHGWRAYVRKGVIEDIQISGKRQIDESQRVIKPESMRDRKLRFGPADAINGYFAYARLFGGATAVFDRQSHPSLEPYNSLSSFFILLLRMIPEESLLTNNIFPLPPRSFLTSDASFSNSSHGESLLHSLLESIDDALTASEYYRSWFLQYQGFELLGWILERISKHFLGTKVICSIFDLVLGVRCVDIELYEDALHLLLFNHCIWQRLKPELQRFWAKKLLEYVQQNATDCRYLLGIHRILDLLSICDEPSRDTSLNAASKTFHKHASPSSVRPINSSPRKVGDGESGLLTLQFECATFFVSIIQTFFETTALKIEGERLNGVGPVNHGPSEVVECPASFYLHDTNQFCEVPGPTSSEILALLNFVCEFNYLDATRQLLELLASLLLPLCYNELTDDPKRFKCALTTYSMLNSCGGVYILLGIGAPESETQIVKNEHENFPFLGSISRTAHGDENQGTRFSGTDNSDLDSSNVSLDMHRQNVITSEKLPRNGLLVSGRFCRPKTRGAFFVLLGRMMQVEQRLVCEKTGKSRPTDHPSEDSALGQLLLRQRKGLGIVLRSIVPPQAVNPNFERKPQILVDPFIIDAVVSVVIGGPAYFEDQDGFVPFDEEYHLAMPDVLPILGSLLSFLRFVDKSMKSRQIRESLLRLTIVLKASPIARDQVTSTPLWFSWLLPVVAFGENQSSQSEEDDSNHLLVEVALDLLCTLIEHDICRGEVNHRDQKHGQSRPAWRFWQAFIDSTVRLCKENYRAKFLADIKAALGDASRRRQVPIINAAIEANALQKAGRIMRIIMERVWDRMMVTAQGDGAGNALIDNFMTTFVLSEEILLDQLNGLRLFPSTPGGILASSTAFAFKYSVPKNGKDPSAPTVVSCNTRCVLDRRSDTKWVDICSEDSVGGRVAKTKPLSVNAQSWLSYRYSSSSIKVEGESFAPKQHRIVFYSVRSAFDLPGLDPIGWTLFGRNIGDDGETKIDETETHRTDSLSAIGWVVLDRRTGIHFSGRYHPISCWVQRTSFFEEYKLVFDGPARGGKYLKMPDGTKVLARMHIGEVSFMECDTDDWHRDIVRNGVTIATRSPTEVENVHSALESHDKSLLRFIDNVRKVLDFVYSSPTPESSKSGFSAHDLFGQHFWWSRTNSQEKIKVISAQRRAVIRLVSHIFRWAQFFPVDLLSKIGRLTDVLIHENLVPVDTSENRNLLFVLLRCLSHGLRSVLTDRSGDYERGEILFALISTIVLNAKSVLPPEFLKKYRSSSADSIPLFFEALSYSSLTERLNKSLEELMEDEIINSDFSFRHNRLGNTSRRDFTSIELFAYGAENSRPLGVSLSVRLLLEQNRIYEDERVFVRQMSERVVSKRVECALRNLIETDEVLDVQLRLSSQFSESISKEIISRSKRLGLRERLLRIERFIHPQLGVPTHLLPNPNGSLHLGRSFGIADRVARTRGVEIDDNMKKNSPAIDDWVNSIGAKFSSIADVSTMNTGVDEPDREESIPPSELSAENATKLDTGFKIKGELEAMPDIEFGKEVERRPKSVDFNALDLEDSNVVGIEKHGSGRNKVHQLERQDGEKQLNISNELHDDFLLTSAGSDKQIDEGKKTEESTLAPDSPGIVSSISCEPSNFGSHSVIPRQLKSRYKLTLEEWVIRRPDSIRGEASQPWPAENERVLAVSRCYLVCQTCEVVGRLILSQSAIYFDPDPVEADMYILRAEDFVGDERIDESLDFDSGNENASFGNNSRDVVDISVQSSKRLKIEKNLPHSRRVWKLEEIERILLRRYRMRDCAIEIFVNNGLKEAFLFDFSPQISCSIVTDVNGTRKVVEEEVKTSVQVRNEFLYRLWNWLPVRVARASHRPQEPLHYLASRYTRAWQQRKISNFEYLMYLNQLSGRSMNDLTQYPVFPWVIADYDSEVLDLTNHQVFRDLSKPMGALTEERLLEVRERYRTFEDPQIPSFHYGSHYSTMAGCVLYYLVRMEPFSSLHVSMQDGHFDVPDRLFNSVKDTWHMCTTAISEVKELTPEFYYLPEFLVNHNGFDLGTTQGGEKVEDVKLPPWANGSAVEFVRKLREALESEYISERLHDWIDLIFGRKSRLPEAVEADNVFYYLTYPGAVNLDAIDDQADRQALELQVKHFGQCPAQIFVRRHPARGKPPRPPYPLSSVLRTAHKNQTPVLLDNLGNELNASTRSVDAKQVTEYHFGNNSFVLETNRGSVLSVRLTSHRALCLFETGHLCSYAWGRENENELEKTDVNTAEDDGPIDSSVDASFSDHSSLDNNDERQALRAKSLELTERPPVPLVLTLAPECFEDENYPERGKSTLHVAQDNSPSLHFLSIASFRRRLRWTLRASKEASSGVRCNEILSTMVDRLKKAVFSWSSDAQILVHAGRGIGAMEVCFFDSDSGYARGWSATVCAHSSDISSLAVSGEYIVSGDENGCVRVWDVYSSSDAKLWGVSDIPKFSLAGHNDSIVSLAVSHLQGIVVSTSFSGICLVHSLCEGDLIGGLRAACLDRVCFAEISNQSGRIAVYTQANKLFIYEVSNIRFPHSVLDLAPFLRTVYSIAFSKQDYGYSSPEVLLCIGNDNTLSVFDLGETPRIISKIHVLPGDKASGSKPDSPNLIRPKDVQFSSYFTAFSLNPSEEAMLIGSEDGSIRILPLPGFQSEGINVTIPIIGSMDVRMRIAAAKSAVLSQLESNPMLVTARGVANEVGDVASKLGNRIFSVLGGNK